MSVAQKIEELRRHLEEDGLEILDELEELVRPYDPECRADHLLSIIHDEMPVETLHHLLDELEMSTAKYSKPPRQRVRSFNKDLMRYFEHCHRFADKDDRHALKDYLALFWDIFGPDKKICAVAKHTCTRDWGCPGRFRGPDVSYCPECGTHRRLCSNKPSKNGRCRTVTSHGGKVTTGALHQNSSNGNLGRVMMYEQSLTGGLQELYVQAVTDQNYLSVAPEIGALSARMGELMSQIGDTDYLAIAASARQSVRRMKKAMAEEDEYTVMEQAEEIDTLLTGVADDKRRWDEIASLTGRVGRLVETERKRLLDEQKMITIQEMYLLQQETLQHIRDAADIVAAKIIESLQQRGEVTQREISHLFVRLLYDLLEGRADAKDMLPSGNETVIIENNA